MSYRKKRLVSNISLRQAATHIVDLNGSGLTHAEKDITDRYVERGDHTSAGIITLKPVSEEQAPMVHLLREDCKLEKLPLEDLLQMEELSSKIVDKPWGRKGPSANRRRCSRRRRVRCCKASNSPSKNNSLLLYAISLQAQLAGVSTPSPMHSNAEAARALRGVDPGVVDLTGGGPGGSNGGHTGTQQTPPRRGMGGTCTHANTAQAAMRQTPPGGTALDSSGRTRSGDDARNRRAAQRAGRRAAAATAAGSLADARGPDD